MDEKYVKKQLRDDLVKKQKIACYRWEDMFTSNHPDMLIARTGSAIWIEAKFSTHPLEPHRWKAYKPAQSEHGRRLSTDTGLPYFYFCRNEIGLWTISTIECVEAARQNKSSMQDSLGCIWDNVLNHVETFSLILLEGFERARNTKIGKRFS